MMSGEFDLCCDFFWLFWGATELGDDGWGVPFVLWFFWNVFQTSNTRLGGFVNNVAEWSVPVVNVVVVHGCKRTTQPCVPECLQN
ncbi:MAG: hypothetical protein Phog2KO_51100 [Phototrophicaceae bacterium]